MIFNKHEIQQIPEGANVTIGQTLVEINLWISNIQDLIRLKLLVIERKIYTVLLSEGDSYL